MPINQVLLSNTFNEFRSTVNDVTNTVNSFTDGTGTLIVSSANVTGNTIYLNNSEIIRDDANVSFKSDGSYIYVDDESIANTGVVAGPYGSASQVPVLVIDQKGRITSASNTNVAGVQAFDFYTSNATLVITTSDGGSQSADISGATAGDADTTYIKYNGTTKTAGQFDGGSTDPDNTTRLNYDGHFYATKFYGDGSGLENAGSTVTNQSSSTSTFYPVFTSVTSGSMTTASVSTTKLQYVPGTGTLTSINFNSTSDLKLKKNISSISNAVQTVKNINGVEFEWKNNNEKSSGVIAQELENVLPHLVLDTEDCKTVNYLGIIAYLVESIKELDERLRKLEGR